MGNQTEKPTKLQLRRLRLRGVVPRSAVFTSSVGFVVAVATAPRLLEFTLTCQHDYLVGLFKNPPEATTTSLSHLLATLLQPQLIAYSLVLGIVVLSLLLVGIAQTGGLVASPTKSSFLSRGLDGSLPLRGLNRDSLLTFGGHVSLTVAAFSLSVWVLLRHADSLVASQGSAVRLTACLVLLSRRILWGFAACLLVGAVLHLVFQWASFRQQSKMTLQQLKHDRREQLGAPEILNVRQRLRTEFANTDLEGMLAHTNLLIDDGATTTALLAYDPSVDAVPRLLKAVLGAERNRVVVAAHRLTIPIVINDWLATRLAGVPPQAPLPAELEPPLAEAYAALLRRPHPPTRRPVETVT